MRTVPSARRRLLLVLAAALATSCSAEGEVPAVAAPSTAATQPSSAAPSPSLTPAAAAPASMTIVSFEYDVPPAVRPGEPITVLNQDREAHTVTIGSGAVRLTVPGGGTATFAAPSQPGEHLVVCDLHGGMEAVLVVA